MATKADVKQAELRGQAKALVSVLRLVSDEQAVELLIAFAGGEAGAGKATPAGEAKQETAKAERLTPPAGKAFFWTDGDTRVHIRTIEREAGKPEAFLTSVDAAKLGLKRVPIGEGTRPYKRSTTYVLDGTKTQAQVDKALAKVVVRDDVASL